MATDSDQAKSDYDQAQAAHEAKATDSNQAKSDQAEAAHEAKASPTTSMESDDDQAESDDDQAESDDEQGKATLSAKAAMAAASFAHQAKAAAAAAACVHQAKAHLIMHLPDQQRSSQTQSCFSTERKHNLTKLTASTVPELPRQVPKPPYYTSSKAAAMATAKAADAFAAAARAAHCLKM